MVISQHCSGGAGTLTWVYGMSKLSNGEYRYTAYM